MLTRIFTALTIIATASVVAATPIEQAKRGTVHTEVAPTISLCTGSVGIGCISVPVVADTCVNFTGGLTFLNKEVSAVVVPGGFACTFTSNFGCAVGQGGGVSLTGGSWNMSNVPGTGGYINFNDEASSFTCSPV